MQQFLKNFQENFLIFCVKRRFHIGNNFFCKAVENIQEGNDNLGGQGLFSGEPEISQPKVWGYPCYGKPAPDSYPRSGTLSLVHLNFMTFTYCGGDQTQRVGRDRVAPDGLGAPKERRARRSRPTSLYKATFKYVVGNS